MANSKFWGHLLYKLCISMAVFLVRAPGTHFLTSAQTISEEYIFTFPAVQPPSTFYHRQAVISTSSEYDVRVFARCGNTTTSETIINRTKAAKECKDSEAVDVSSSGETFPSATTVLIQSEEGPVNVYAYQFFKEGNPSFLDAVHVQPVRQLGERYVVVTPPTQPLAITGQQGLHFVHVTATQNDTRVTITSPRHHGLHVSESCAGGAVTLQRLETKSCRSNLTDLTGVVVEADKPVAVSSGVVRGSVEGCQDSNQDHLWAFLPPIELWGRQYFAFPTPDKADSDPYDIYHIVNAENDTTVWVGTQYTLWRGTPLSSVVFNANAGVDASYELDTRNFHLIHSDKPIMVVKTLRQSLCDVCMLTLTPLHRSAKTLTFALPDTSGWPGRSNYSYHMTIITLTSAVEDITLNRVKVNEVKVNWTQIKDTQFVGGHVTLPLTDDVHVLSSVTGTSRMIAYVTGGQKFRKMCTAVGEGSESSTNGMMTSRSYTSYSKTDATTTTTSEIDTTIISTLSSSTTKSLDSGPTKTTQQTSTERKFNAGESTTTDGYFTTTKNDITTQKDKLTTTEGKLTTTESKFTTTENKITTTKGKTDTTNDEITTAKRDATTTKTEMATTTEENTADGSPSTPVTASKSATSTTIALTTLTAVMTTFSTARAHQQSTSPNSAPLLRTCRCVETEPKTKEEESAVNAAIAGIKSSLTVPTGSLSAAVRRVSSARDARLSSALLGSTAVVCVCLILAVPMIMDFMNLVSWLTETKRTSRVKASLQMEQTSVSTEGCGERSQDKDEKQNSNG